TPTRSGLQVPLHSRWSGAPSATHANLLHSFLLRRPGGDLGDHAKAIGFSVVRAGDEGPADLDCVPARHHTEAKRLFCLNVPGREILHQVLSVGRSILHQTNGEISVLRAERSSRSALRASRVRSSRTAFTRSR